MGSIFGDGLSFAFTPESRHEIKVVGVGGGGSNAVSYMFNQKVASVDYAICNTDSQALKNSPVPIKIQLGAALTEGLGAGARPEIGRRAAEESIDDLKTLFPDKTKMVFITAGMGGGTGTGAAPVIARIAKEQGKLVIAIVTTPFSFEGPKRNKFAEEGIAELRKCVDSIIIINNDKIFDIYPTLDYVNTFALVDQTVCIAAQNIAEVINKTLTMNVDFADTRTLLTGSGTTLLGSGKASGADKVIQVTAQALESPLLNDNDISGAKGLLFIIKHGKGGLKASELNQIATIIKSRSGNQAEVIWGIGPDDTLEDDQISLLIIAAGFPSEKISRSYEQEPRKVHQIAPEGPLSKHIESVEFARYEGGGSTFDSRTEKRVVDAQECEYTVFSLKMDTEDKFCMPIPPKSSFVPQDTNTSAYTRFDSCGRGDSRNYRSDNVNPLECDLNELSQIRQSPQSNQDHIRQSHCGTNTKEIEPAYKRQGLNIDLRPESETDIRLFKLDMDQ